MKRLFVAFSIVVITLLCSISVFAMDTDDSGKWEYQTYGTGVELTKYNGNQTDVYVPSKITKGDTEYSVLKLGESLFSGNPTLNSATLGEGITEIGASAFEGATGLVCIVTPESLTTIGANAFADCTNFNSVILYDGVTSIGENAFKNCPKTTIYCNRNSAGHTYAFQNNISISFLESDSIPETVTENDFTFYILNGEAVLLDYTGKAENVIIPATVKGHPVASILCNFSYSKMVSIPDTVKALSSFSVNTILCFNENSISHEIAEKQGLQYFVMEYGTFPETITDGIFEYFNINDKYAVLKKCDNNATGDIEVPEKINGLPVKKIYKDAFDFCYYITKLTLPETIEDIFASTFVECNSLESVNIPSNVKIIREDTFSRCPNLTIELGNNIQRIKAGGISEIYSVTLPNNRDLVLDKYAVKLVNNITIPEKVENINYESFIDLSQNGFSCFYVYPDSPAMDWAKENSLTYCEIGKSYENRDGYIVFDDRAILTELYVSEEPENGTITVEIPAEISGVPVTAIADDMIFHWLVDWGYDELKLKIILPETITDIGRRAFSYCSPLSEINIPDGVRVIRERTFEGCENLKTIVLPESLEVIEKEAFKYSGIEYVNFPESISYIGDMAFSYSALKEVTYPIAEIGEMVFEYCYNLKVVTIVDGVTTISPRAFGCCPDLETAYVPSSVKNFEYHCFWNNPKLILISDSNADIEQQASFMYAKENGIMYNNYLWDSLTTREEYTQDGIIYYLVHNSMNHITLNISNWSAIVLGYDETYGDTVVIPKTVNYGNNEYEVTKIGDSAFSSTRIKEAVLPESVKIIGDCAFNNSGIKKVNLPKNLTRIGATALPYTEFEEFVYPSNSIGESAFAFISTKKIVIPEGITQLPDYTFYFATYVEEIELPGTLVKIGKNALYGLGAKEVTIPASVNLDEYKIEGLLAEKLIVSEGVTSINENFSYCNGLKYIFLPKSLSHMDYFSFKDSKTAIFCVYEDTYALEWCKKKGVLYHILKDNSLNPEISYGSGITGTAKYTDGTLASGATVEILYDDGTLKESVTTDVNGNYEFTYAEVGRYSIHVTDADGNTASEIVSVKRMNVFDVYLAGETDLVLKKGYAVSGTVSLSTSTVILADTSGNIIKSVDTIDGTFTFADIPRGSYIVKAENENGSVITEIYVSNEDVTGISLEIQAQSATITGDTKIKNRDGTYSAKIWVNIDLINSDGNVVASTKTDADGKYTFNNIPVGSYNIVATTNEMRPSYAGSFNKSFDIKGYGHVDITETGEYIVDIIILREDKVNLSSVSGQVVTNAEGYVYLTDEDGNQISYCKTKNNGKFSFVNVPDGVYSITAITAAEGMGFVIITVENGNRVSNIKIHPIKVKKVSDLEDALEIIPKEVNSENALLYKEYIYEAKKTFENLSDKEQRQVSKDAVNKLYKYISFYSNNNTLEVTDGVTVDNIESVISADEIGEALEFVLKVAETEAVETDEDGINTNKEYEHEKIKDKKGKNKEIAKYYDISLTKNGKNISNIRKQTETNGKLRITMEIPEEHRGHKHYSFIHMHKGEAVTLVDLDNNPNTITFEIDKFSTFALAYSDDELIGDVETYPASIVYNAETGKISVSSTETGKLYIATYDGERLSSVAIYDVTANVAAIDYAFASNQAAFVWGENLKPLCEKFIIGN